MAPELKCRPHHEGRSRSSNTNPLQAIYPVSHRPRYLRRGEGPHPLRRGKEPAHGRTHPASKLDVVGQPRRGSHEHKRVMSSRIWYGECVCVVISFILGVRLVDAPAVVTEEKGHTGFLHLPSAVLALILLARRIQPFPFPSSTMKTNLRPNVRRFRG